MVVNLEERSIVSINYWIFSLIFDQDENLTNDNENNITIR